MTVTSSSPTKTECRRGSRSGRAWRRSTLCVASRPMISAEEKPSPSTEVSVSVSVPLLTIASAVRRRHRARTRRRGGRRSFTARRDDPRPGPGRRSCRAPGVAVWVDLARAARGERDRGQEQHAHRGGAQRAVHSRRPPTGTVPATAGSVSTGSVRSLSGARPRRREGSPPARPSARRPTSPDPGPAVRRRPDCRSGEEVRRRGGGRVTVGTALRRRPGGGAGRRGLGLRGLYRDLAPAVTGYLRLHGAVEPDDLASETFIGVFTGLTGFSGDEAALRDGCSPSPTVGSSTTGAGAAAVPRSSTTRRPARRAVRRRRRGRRAGPRGRRDGPAGCAAGCRPISERCCCCASWRT